MARNRLYIILGIAFVDLLGFSLILPLLPFYAETFGASPTLIGFLIASFSIMQLMGAPWLGRLSDRYGRRPILLLSILGTAIGFVLFGLANSLWMLFASRMLDGFTGGNIAVAQAYIADVSPEKERARNFGYFGAAFGIGFIIGPVLGGSLSVWGFDVPAFVAAGFATLNLIATYLFLPESLTKEERQERSLVSSTSRILNFKTIGFALIQPRSGPLLRIRFMLAFAFSTFQTIFPLFTEYRLGFNAQQTGYVLGYAGVLVVLIQGLAIGLITKRIPATYLITWAAALFGCGLCVWSFITSTFALYMVLIPIAFSVSILDTVVNSTLSQSVSTEELGSTLGVSTSLESLTRVIAPPIGGFLLAQIGTWSPGIFGSLLVFTTLPYIWYKMLIKPDIPLSAKAGQKEG